MHTTGWQTRVTHITRRILFHRQNHFDVHVILRVSLRNGLVWTGKRRTLKTWTIVKFELFKVTLGIRNSRSEETHFLTTSFLDLIKLHFGFWGMRISQNLERTEFLFMSFFGLISILFSFFLSFSPFPFFSIIIWFCFPLYRLSFSQHYGWLLFFYENRFYKNIEAEIWEI